MPSMVLCALPFLLAVVVALLPRGTPVRYGAAGVMLVALAAAAASRVTAGSASFQVINNILLWGGLLLGGVAVVEAGRKRWRGVPAPPPDLPHAVTESAALRRRWGMPVLLSLLLIPAAWFVLTVAGPEGWSLDGFRNAPFSAAAETFLAALLLPASLVLAGTWPFGGMAPGARYASIGALLLLAVVLPLAGQGLEHWRSLYAGWLVLGALVAAAAANWPGLLACVGLFVIACGGGTVAWAGLAMTVIASGMSLSISLPDQWRRTAMLAAAGCGILSLRATLGVEVVYSVLLLLATLVGVFRSGQPATANA